MLNLNCVICAELFSQTDDVYVTKCGHMFHYSCLCQWLERSKTCPQCRNKCTDANVHRVYFNLANLDTSKIDIGTLQEQLDNANLKVKISEKDIRKAEEEVKNLKQTQKKCMKTIFALEKTLKKNDFVILSYTEQLKMAKTQAKEAEELRKEIKVLKEKITMMESVSSILASATYDAEKLVKEESNAFTLAVWVSALKRELRTCESKRTDLRNILKVVQNDFRKETEIRKNREEQVAQLESDNYNLKQKLNKIDSEKEKERLNAAYVTDSPSTSHSEKNRMGLLQQEAKRLSISPSIVRKPESDYTINAKVKQIEESNSPYLNIKSSGVPFSMLGLGAMRGADPEKSLKNDLSEKFTIFKKPRLMVPPSGVISALRPGRIYDGFGGTEREPIVIDDDDRKRMNAKKAASQSLSNRLKSGKLRKFPSAGSETMDKFLSKKS